MRTKTGYAAALFPWTRSTQVLRLVPDDARAKTFVVATAARRPRGSDRPERRAAAAEDLLMLPTIEEFTTLARRHAPKPTGPKA